jgi:hypothetical protein
MLRNVPRGTLWILIDGFWVTVILPGGQAVEGVPTFENSIYESRLAPGRCWSGADRGLRGSPTISSQAIL